jgi:hypothetical protein
VSYFESPEHAFLPPVIDPMAYLQNHNGMGLTNAGSAPVPRGRLGEDGNGGTKFGYFTRFLVLTGLNFVLLWLFIKEFGIALVIGGVLGLVEAAVTG